MENVRIAKCEHTSKLVVQEKFGEEWVCMHGENDKEDVELINKVKMNEFSDCCGASEWLEGTGICGACGEHADFNEIEDEA